jgi:serine/threonine protein kinase
MSDDQSLSGGFPSLPLIEADSTVVQTRGPWSLDEKSRTRFDAEMEDSVDELIGPVDEASLPAPPRPGEPPLQTPPPRAAAPAPVAAPASASPRSAVPAPAAAPGLLPRRSDSQQIIGGKYLVEARIGAGGMGNVYRVKHTELGKTFALKIMRSVLVDDEAARRAFFREARLASGLSHPQIVSIVDFGDDPAYGVYMVMELIDGEPLRKVLGSRGRFPLKQAGELMLQIADAIRYVHEKGVVHCDIKAENVLLVTERSELGRRAFRAKLLDFGLARAQANPTESVNIQGTPAYLAPERIKGAAPAPSMDIYALGILFYELLTGSPPWLGAMHLVLACHVNEQPRAVSEVIGQTVDERVEAFIKKALAKDPAARHPTVGQFIYELRTTMEMLGFDARRRTASQGVRRGKRSTELVEAAFADGPLPLAVFNIEGTILIGNKAFSIFLYREPVDLRGVDLAETPLAQACPSMRHEIRTALAEGRTVRVGFQIPAEGGGPPVRLVAWLQPGPEDADHVYCAIHVANTWL